VHSFRLAKLRRKQDSVEFDGLSWTLLRFTLLVPTLDRLKGHWQ